jgi:NADH:ubiquinone oxidoreductase subunit 2 (subunit N)
MATGTSGSSNGILYFVVGALVVAVIVLGVMFFNAERNDSPLENAAEVVSEAADEVGDAARNAN